MQRRSVTSSNVASVGWEEETLEVEFVSGHVYLYHEVPEGEYQALLGADSIGRALSSLRDKYTSTRLR
jgi:hypothetical protein